MDQTCLTGVFEVLQLNELAVYAVRGLLKADREGKLNASYSNSHFISHIRG